MGEFARQKILLALLSLKRIAPQADIVVPAHFEGLIDRSAGPWGCWPWAGSASAEGYGLVRVRAGGLSASVGAHRVAYYLDTGFWHWGRFGPVIRHLCHSPSCCNPKHLLAGSRGENVWDDQMRAQGVDLVAIRRSLEEGPFYLAVAA